MKAKLRLSGKDNSNRMNWFSNAVILSLARNLAHSLEVLTSTFLGSGDPNRSLYYLKVCNTCRLSSGTLMVQVMGRRLQSPDTMLISLAGAGAGAGAAVCSR